MNFREDSPDREEAHVIKGLGRTLRFSKPERSLDKARTSPLRWWWEYLRLSKDYWLLSKTQDRGISQTQDQNLMRVYRAFRDVHSGSFEDWWLDRGYRVFSETERFPKVVLVPESPADRTHQAPEAGKIWVEIPLKLSTRTVQRQIGRLLADQEQQRLDNRRRLTSARFQLAPTFINLRALRRGHELFCLHRELIAKPKALKHLGLANTNDGARRADLFKIGKLLDISPSNALISHDPDETRRRQARMRIGVSRMLQKVNLLVANVERGVFPSYDAYEILKRFNNPQMSKHRELEAEWWSLDLTSTLSQGMVERIKDMPHFEPERGRTLLPTRRRVRTDNDY